MHWLQDSNGKISLQELQLDIVGFLAILGEGSVLANAQVSTLSKWIFLPRLLPAPQALMRPTRPKVLEPALGHTTGIYGDYYIDTIHHIGNIVCDASNLPAKTIAPITIVLFLGFFLSALLLGLSIWQDDGMSIVATILLSLLSTLIGLGNKWTLTLPDRKVPKVKVPKVKVPQGDFVIRYPNNSFLVVRCEEDVARNLYFAPQWIKYLLQHEPAYRMLNLVGTMMLMSGVICLANARIQLQIAWAGAYMLLCSSYWIVAALPGKLHWDFSCYTVKNECFSDSKMNIDGYPSINKTFIQALWKVIVVSKNVEWVKRSNACPDTQAWRAWLNAASEVARTVRLAERENTDNGEAVTTWLVPNWDPQGYLEELLGHQAKQDAQSVKEGV